jgi:hypothetical protein
MSEMHYCKICREFHEYDGMEKLDACILDEKIIFDMTKFESITREFNEKYIQRINKVSGKSASYRKRQE